MEEKRQIVAEAMQPGVSVASVARRHGMNDNVIFNWRKQLKDGDPRMLPVKVIPNGVTLDARPSERRGISDVFIEIRTLEGHVVRIGAEATPQMVQVVLAALR